jgi:hypothetical protein
MHDTMFEENFGNKQYVPQQIMIVKASRMLSGIVESKEHLPLLPAEIYLQTHQHERGFSVKDVESSLMRIIIQKGPEIYISWDDIIDIFIHRDPSTQET